MRGLLATLVFTLLTGCGTFVRTNVSVFHELDSSLSGVTYTIVPSNEQKESLEFRSYAKLIKNQLQTRGMSEVPYKEAKYAILMQYGIDNGQEVVSTYPIFGQTGVSSTYTTGSVNVYGNTATYNESTYVTPTFGVVGTGTSSDTVFTRYLNLDIVDIANSGDGKVRKVYEGKAISKGSSSQLAPVMPYMVKSVFEDFPGTSGSTKTIELPLQK
ncbi:DUF4136 domain-containing protein [Chitinibacter tainanensis]|uniref:DUF4136 domain-containing protein n=1 Tax=Chitinibacter tainanensis TaxID=230667 RepID=UPI00041844E6|nr:DUF4136 domain-containing protein [Chitinibacter tainanensis]